MRPARRITALCVGRYSWRRVPTFISLWWHSLRHFHRMVLLNISPEEIAYACFDCGSWVNPHVKLRCLSSADATQAFRRWKGASE